MYPKPRWGCVLSSANKVCDVGKIWCTNLASQFSKKEKKKSSSVAQTDVALVVVAGVVGGEHIAKTGHCGFAYKKTARYLKRVVLK